MKRINIMVIIPSFAGGGAEKVILNFFEKINTKNFSATLVVQNKTGPLKHNINRSKIINLNYKKFRYALPKLLSVIINNRPDIILSTFPHITLSLLFFKKFFYKNTIVISREPNMVSPSLNNSPFSIMFKFLYKVYMPLANKIIVTSIAMKNDLIFRGIKKENLFLIHNPINSTKIRNIKKVIRQPGKGLRFIFAGRLVHQKGLDRILSIIREIDNCHITILGDGNNKALLQNIVKNLGIKDKVKFIGFVSNANSYIAGADYLLLPSRWEGLPNVVLESLVLGTPVISFKEIVGLNDIIPLVPKKQLYLCSNESAMQKILEKLNFREDYDCPSLRNNLLNTFNTPEEYAQKIEEVIKGLISE